MNIQIDKTHLETGPSLEMDVFLGSGFQRSSVEIGGMSFSPMPMLGRMVFAAVIGTIPVAIPESAANPQNMQVRLAFPGDMDHVDEYSRIRQEMIASGIPMLTDEELRREIKERKGRDSEN